MLVGRFVDSKGNVIASEGTNGWVTVNNFSYDTGTANFRPASGHQPDPLDVSLDIAGDALSVALEQATLAGSGVSFQVESLALIGGIYRLVDEYLFAVVKPLVVSTGSFGSSDFLIEAGAFTHSHVAHDAKGAVTSTSSTGWDITAKASVTLPDTVDFLPASDHAASHDEALTYVVRFIDGSGKFVASDAGSTGWVSADGFSVNLGLNSDVSGNLTITDDRVQQALTTAMLNGTTVRVDVEAYRTTASGLQLVDDYLFASTSLNIVEDASNGVGQIGFDAIQYTHVHDTYDAKGVATATVSGWDYKGNTSTTLSDLGNYATAGVPAVAVDAPVALTYYARIVESKTVASDGSGGWVALTTYGQDLQHNSAGNAGAMSLEFGDDRLSQALTQAYLSGATNLAVEIDGFAGTQLVDQQLFTNVSVTRRNDYHAGETQFNLAFQQAQESHAVDSKTNVITGWNVATDASTSLTSSGAYVTGTAAGGAVHDITYYMRLVDQNGQTILTDGGRAFNEIAAMSLTLDPGQPDAFLGVALGSDQALLATLQALVQANPLLHIEIEGYVDSPTGPRIIDEYLFDTVHVTGQAEGGAPQGSLSFSFTDYQQAHYYLSGASLTYNMSGWDFSLNHAVATFVTPHADLFS